MISWRGVWYVEHLGAILRSIESGKVDEPASGRGRSLYSGTCRRLYRAKPSIGLEPMTPSLPWKCSTN